MQERAFKLTSESVARNACLVIRNLPIDGSMEVVLREVTKRRTSAQNRLLWGSMVRDISEQAWVDGKRFSADCWHEYLKRRFMPEGDEPEFAKLVHNPEKYRKWEDMPGGERRCCASTTSLTKFGIGWYMDRCTSYAAGELGVRFLADA